MNILIVNDHTAQNSTKTTGNEKNTYSLSTKSDNKRKQYKHPIQAPLPYMAPQNELANNIIGNKYR